MKKTTINSAHYHLGGKMIDFFGWDLPVQYSGLSEEHNAVRTNGGIFDVSHMGEIFIKGDSALDAVQYITSNNISKLKPGKILYTALPNEKGCFIDDMLVYMITDKEYLLVVNAANLEKDFKWISSKVERFGVSTENRSDEYTQIAIQGPNAEKLLTQFTNDKITELKYYNFLIGKVGNIDAIISRTGYTGEDGFEIYFKSDEKTASGLFIDLAEKGKDLGIIPAGLGARDTLRLESKMALYGNDIDDSHTILEADLGWILKLKKGDFIGREPLLKQKEEGISRKLVGFELTEKGVPRHGYKVFVDGKHYSEVTSGTFAPFIRKPIGLVYLPLEHSEIGSKFHVEIRGKQVEAKVVETPFYKRSS
ncbi:MAG: glycine cleavage system aminomethyltransferase GcvT [Candidatus Aminicenantes bacterium]|nr:glycine cleavage system aminomethyltransferase GcvT [Candidatus Aminicenantes bacterium]